MSSTANNVDAKVNSPKTRSPNYPAFSLKEAVAKLNLVFPEMRRHAVGVEIAAKLLGYKYTSSSGKMALAAMRAFGLFVDEPGRDALVRLSGTALDICADYKEGTVPWSDAVKRAALTPKVHKQLWEKYGAELPPEDEIRRYLIRELKFSDSAVGQFIAEYKATMDFARLTSSGKSAGESKASDSNELKDYVPGSWQGKETENRAREQVSLAEGPIVLERPENLSPESVDEFEKWANLAIQRVRRKSGQNITRRLPTGEFVHLIRYPDNEVWRIRSFDRSWLSSDGTQLVTATAFAEKNGWTDLEFKSPDEAVAFVQQIVAK